MKIIPLSEGTFTVDKTKKFIPFDKEKDKLQDRPVGSLLVEIQPFCIITQKDIIVIDTGLGFEAPSGKMQIHQNLIDNGINPAEVTKVLLSHLHKDHSGGIATKFLPAHELRLSFPQATYYVHHDELLQHFEAAESDYDMEEVALLKQSENLVMYGNEGVIDDYIFYQHTGGHSKFHCVFWIKEENETIFFGGDVAPQLQQMKNKFVAKYDYDGKKCMELRQQWWEQGKNEGWTFLFYHDIKHPIVHQ